jgi:para-nitrobenzyl esterase
MQAMGSVAAVILMLGVTAMADSPRPTVKTQAGQVRGIVRGSVAEYFGIPYAAPPIGELRWQPPKPHANWAGILDASRVGSVCAQMKFRHPGMQGSEDCLYLNIYTPSTGSHRLPVMVWIHGGTFIGGAGAWYHGDKLAARGNLIVVMINYRLGPFGFLASPSLDGADPRRHSGNY